MTATLRVTKVEFFAGVDCIKWTGRDQDWGPFRIPGGELDTVLAVMNTTAAFSLSKAGGYVWGMYRVDERFSRQGLNAANVEHLGFRGQGSPAPQIISGYKALLSDAETYVTNLSLETPKPDELPTVREMNPLVSVHYTHLTLPTNLRG